jgi:hypothetical protein
VLKLACKKLLVYNLRQHHADALHYHLGILDWSCLLSCKNVQTVHHQFLQTVKCYIELCIPIKTVPIGRRDPGYISPLVKVLLNKRNKLAPGGDELSYWLFKLCSYELAEAVAHINNCSLRSSVLTRQ